MFSRSRARAILALAAVGAVVLTPAAYAAPGDSDSESGSTPGAGTGAVLVDANFADDFGGWQAHAGSGDGPPTIKLVDADGAADGKAVLITDRKAEGDGIEIAANGLLKAGVKYNLEARVKFADSQEAGDMTFSFHQVLDGKQDWLNPVQIPGVSNSEWTEVSASFTLAPFDTGEVYFEAKYGSGITSDFLVDSVTITQAEAPQVQDLPGIKDAVDFPLGVAIDNRETSGAAADLLTRHFGQITGENHMKPEAWYSEDAAHTFGLNPQAADLMAFAQDNDLRMYGHVLVWHSQTPDWFFQDDTGRQLTNSDADQAFMRDRMRNHINNVAKALSDDYGLFGSADNPLVAFDVVNEVVADGTENADGLRRSPWFDILGEQYIDLAFQYADEAFNHTYADPAATRPVALFINDYNTEQSGKQQRYHDLVARLLERGVPVDGVGHQFHVSLATPISALDGALTAFQDLPVKQAVTEFDVPTGTPVTQANLIEQGHFIKDAFDVFNKHADDLFSVTVWGLTDGRSWRNDSGAPLLFDNDYQAKPAYFGAVGGAQLAPLVRTATVFGPAAADTSAASSEWSRLPLNQIGEAGSFGLRWVDGELLAFVQISDDSPASSDQVTFTLDGQIVTVNRLAEKSFAAAAAPAASSEVLETEGGYVVVAHLPLDGAKQGDTALFDVSITDGATTTGWNSPGALGVLTLAEALSYHGVTQAPSAPAIDGDVDAMWADVTAVSTGKTVEGTPSAVGQAKLLWLGETLYVLAEVTDPIVDVSGSDPWIQDSVELYVDRGNAKNGSYREDDMQLRISANNALSFGSGASEDVQRSRITSATVRTDSGYRVEAAVDLGESGGVGTFQGFDFQINDASNGSRTAITNWADPTGSGYLSTAHWGVLELLPAQTAPGGDGDTDSGGTDSGDTDNGDTNNGGGIIDDGSGSGAGNGNVDPGTADPGTADPGTAVGDNTGGGAGDGTNATAEDDALASTGVNRLVLFATILSTLLLLGGVGLVGNHLRANRS